MSRLLPRVQRHVLSSGFQRENLLEMEQLEKKGKYKYNSALNKHAFKTLISNLYMNKSHLRRSAFACVTYSDAKTIHHLLLEVVQHISLISTAYATSGMLCCRCWPRRQKNGRRTTTIEL